MAKSANKQPVNTIQNCSFTAGTGPKEASLPAIEALARAAEANAKAIEIMAKAFSASAPGLAIYYGNKEDS